MMRLVSDEARVCNPKGAAAWFMKAFWEHTARLAFYQHGGTRPLNPASARS